MLNLRIVVWMFSICLMVLGVGVASGQNYPNKPIRILTSAAGGGNDFLVRLIAPGLSDTLGQPVIVENRGGLVIAIETVAKAPPDGYTLLLAADLWAGPLLNKLSYDAVRDFSPISFLTRAPTLLLVYPGVAANSVKELIALAKARPGELNYASSSIGAASHIASELFKSMAGVNIVHVPFKGTGPALISLIGGQVQLYFSPPGSVSSQIRAGKLRALAVTSAEPTALFPGMPTVAASLPGYDISDKKGLFAPRGTPAAIIRRLNREVVMALNPTDIKEMLFKVGSETVGSSPEEFAAVIKAETARLRRVIKDASIRAD